MSIRLILAVVFLLIAAAWGQDHADREKLLGTWQVAEGNSHQTWLLESKGDVLHVVRTEDGHVTLDVNCKPGGIDCSGSDGGKKVTVSMYFNGSSLVQMETSDSGVTTRTFSLQAGMDRMTIDIKPITGPGKPYSLPLTRQVQVAAHE